MVEYIKQRKGGNGSITAQGILRKLDIANSIYFMT